jgi:hypothetical protein
MKPLRARLAEVFLSPVFYVPQFQIFNLMKTTLSILALSLVVAAFIGGFFYGRIKTTTPQQLTLEQILSIRELHLVKHTYNDLFYLHKKNNPAKAIRAIVQVPVTITAYLNLKDIEVISHGDSVQQIILPKATLSDPVYHVNNMISRETRSFQIHAGKDLYPLVGSYLGTLIDSRMDTTRHMAEANRILLQTEAEGKEYIEGLLHLLGRTDIEVTFNDAEKDQTVAEYLATKRKKIILPPRNFTQAAAIPFGYLPLK